MRIEIFHREHSTGAYVPVAHVVSGCVQVEAALEDAYCMTQNINGSWSQGRLFEDGTVNEDYRPAVERLAPLHVHDGKTYGLRSSSMGDVFKVQNGDLYVCALVGFKKIASMEEASEYAY